jgi:hypothetical protein
MPGKNKWNSTYITDQYNNNIAFCPLILKFRRSENKGEKEKSFQLGEKSFHPKRMAKSFVEYGLKSAGFPFM